MGGMQVEEARGLGKTFCPNFTQPFSENIDKRSLNDGSRELILVFYDFGSSPQVVPLRGVL